MDSTGILYKKHICRSVKVSIIGIGWLTGRERVLHKKVRSRVETSESVET